MGEGVTSPAGSSRRRRWIAAMVVYAAVAAALWPVPPEALAFVNVAVPARWATNVAHGGDVVDRRVERRVARIVSRGPAIPYKTRLLVLLAIIVLVIWLLYRTLTGWRPLIS